MITFIVPSHDQKEFLPEAIESVLKQIGDNELIIVDDGSTDSSLEIAQEAVRTFPGAFVISQVNKGLASARNTGLMNASPYSSWIWPLDADDKLMDGAVEKMEKILKKTDADIIAPSFKTFGLYNQDLILMDNPKLEDFRAGNRISYFSVVRKRLLLEVGGYSPRMAQGYEDLHLWINLLTKGAKIATIKEPLAMYRTKEGSMWRNAREHHDALLAIINKDFPEAKLDFKYAS